MDSCSHFLAAAEHRLIPSRALSICHQLRKAGYQSVWAPACRDQVAGSHAGVGVVGHFLLCVTPEFKGFFRFGRVLRTTLPTGKGGGSGSSFLLFTAIRRRRRKLIQLLLSDKLLQAVLAEAQVVCVGQPPLIAGDLNADPAVFPCLAGVFLLVVLLIWHWRILVGLVLHLTLPVGSVQRMAPVRVGIFCRLSQCAGCVRCLLCY